MQGQAEHRILERVDQVLVADLGHGYYRLNFPGPSAGGFYLLASDDAKVFPFLSLVLGALGLECMLTPYPGGTLWLACRRYLDLQMVTFRWQEPNGTQSATCGT